MGTTYKVGAHSLKYLIKGVVKKLVQLLRDLIFLRSKQKFPISFPFISYSVTIHFLFTFYSSPFSRLICVPFIAFFLRVMPFSFYFFFVSIHCISFPIHVMSIPTHQASPNLYLLPLYGSLF